MQGRRCRCRRGLVPQNEWRAKLESLAPNQTKPLKANTCKHLTLKVGGSTTKMIFVDDENACVGKSKTHTPQEETLRRKLTRVALRVFRPHRTRMGTPNTTRLDWIRPPNTSRRRQRPTAQESLGQRYGTFRAACTYCMYVQPERVVCTWTM